MVNVHTRQVSGWTYDTSNSSGMSVAVVATENGKIILKSPSGQRYAFDYTAVGAGASMGFKLPGIGKLSLDGKLSANFALQANTSGGQVYILESFKGQELAAGDITGFCLLLELSVAMVRGITGAAMICHLSPRDLRDGLLEEFVIDSSVSPMVADILNKAGITDALGIQGATSVILMYGINQGLQAFAGGTAYLGYVSIGAPPDEDPGLMLDLPTREDGVFQVKQTSQDSGWITVGGDLLFRFGHYDLTPRAQRVLAQIATVLRSRAAQRIMVNGYTDSVGAAGFNLTLSRFRAKTVAEWLSRHMAPTTAQIDWQGFGEADPVAPNSSHGTDDPRGRRRNRRVEIHFYKT
jgi:outer membrane protein OmpA-like peptidoglycan-associated protein